MSGTSSQRLLEIAQVFFKLGVIGFGGPAAHIAMMEEEVVTRREWIDRSRFLDLIGATNLIPGPNSTEMAIHLGYIQGGFFGLIIAGVCFLFPAVLITGIFAWIYVSYGDLPQIAPLFYGIKPAVLAVILGALWKLGKKAIKGYQFVLIGFGVAVLLLLGINEVIALLIGGFVGMLLLQKVLPKETAEGLIGVLSFGTILKAVAATTAKTIPPLWKLGLFFLKVGSILFGSGYVLIAFIEGELVNQNGWLTQQQLLDAIAIGQFTPGPVLSTSTFIGYVVAGIPGAIVATLGIFFPSFIFVLILNPLIPKLRNSAWTSAFLDAVNVSAVGLMAVLTLQLAYSLFLQPLDYIAILIFILGAIALFRFKLSPLWLVFGGAILGLIFNLLNLL
ncbi:chromate efflux transporter [Dactylococcopsis salina]|uniref:Chromate transporter, chromate ion transporter family n=1 Tax=Dactylococcopsis salina (strain PCC 8305) TaxID=13035 RepID=K9YV93_DACS8|nr:chromate efflux transporter [Dactylococcopsis salina]AFZ50245.1 chromate transporter, chromate ion transporter family [Dactylococcopsis salina PCC 8305]